MSRYRTIELLAPAKNLHTGIEAILHGADAVYIGAPRYGARSAVGCSVADIKQLCDFAHIYNARIYVALNTILYQNELSDAQRIIYELYYAGVDALIVQDMSILKLDLPPIALHASTQCDNRTPEKVKFLANAGFSQVVLARELSVAEIKNIAQVTNVPLEVFVHGALCVSYSGQCYLSAAINGRSANRGECAQCCRLPYTLIDGKDKVILRNKHLLSLKDLNQSSRLEEIIDAGASSFKIEGRLKDVSYVKNITAYYRQQLDNIISRRNDIRRASDGISEITFKPNPYKSFNRGFTHYFLDGRNKTPIIQPHSPKSIGEPIGHIQSVINNRTFAYKGAPILNNGDGLCFIDKTGNFCGFRINKVEGDILHTATPQKIPAGSKISRNYDKEFEAALSHPTAQRYIPIDITLNEHPEGFSISITDGTTYITHRCLAPKSQARTSQSQRQQQELSKLGNTPYRAKNVNIALSQDYFIPPSTLSTWRREAIEWFSRARRLAYRPERRKQAGTLTMKWQQKSIDYHANVVNSMAAQFYKEHGVETIDYGFEINANKDCELMRTRHCIRHYLGACLKTPQGRNLEGPLYLQQDNIKLSLQFDCSRCEMIIKRES